MLFTKPISDITWNDIENFCSQQIPESANLDYKEDFPANLEKTISAFANTLGGIILIGIEEDASNKPKLPIKGIVFQRGLSEKITNIIMSNIVPPIFPDINVITADESNRAVVIIKVPQSHLSPHAISNSTRVYLRTNNKNSPEELARIDDIFWLNEQREKSINLRSRLITSINERFDNFYNRAIKDAENKNRKLQRISNGWLTLLLSPVYPKNALTTPPDIRKFLPNIQVKDYYRTSRHFPLPDNSYQGSIVQNGIVLKEFLDEMVFYTEMNSFGIYFYRQTLLRKYSQEFEHDPCEIIRASELYARFDQFIDSGIKFYKQINYSGNVLFIVQLENIMECVFGPYPEDSFAYSSDNKFVFDEAILLSSLQENKIEIISKGIQSIGWNFGLNITSPMIESYYQKYKN